MCCPYTPVDVISLPLLEQHRHENKLKIQHCWPPCGEWILLTGFSARPWLVSLSLLAFQCRPLAGWEGLRFVLCMLWSVQSLPAALRVEERRQGGRKGGMNGGFRRGRRANKASTAPNCPPCPPLGWRPTLTRCLMFHITLDIYLPF